MKFEFNINECKDLGLIVKRGNKDNIVVFFDAIEEASGYIIELYRADFMFPSEGFLQAANVKSEKVRQQISPNEYKEIEITSLDIDGPAYIGNELVVTRRWNERDYHQRLLNYSQVEKYSFDRVKPICSIDIDRNQYYANIDFLPYGNYLLILKVENRSGEILATTIPYYFVVLEDNKNAILENIESRVRALTPSANIYGGW